MRYVVRWRDGDVNRSKVFDTEHEAASFNERVVVPERSSALRLPRELARGLAEALAGLPPLGPGADPIIQQLLRNAYDVEDALAQADRRAANGTASGYASLATTVRPVGGYIRPAAPHQSDDDAGACA
jgi:hypothetical protein